MSRTMATKKKTASPVARTLRTVPQAAPPAPAPRESAAARHAVAATLEALHAWRRLEEDARDETDRAQAVDAVRALAVLLEGDERKSADLGKVAARLLKNPAGRSTGLALSRSGELDELRPMLASMLERARPSSEIARALSLWVSTTPTIGALVAAHAGVKALRVLEAGENQPKLVRAIEHVLMRAEPGNHEGTAEKVLTEFLLACGVPERIASNAWDYDDKRKKRSAG